MCQVNTVHRGLIGKPGSAVFQMNGQSTAQNTHEVGADGELPAFFNWSNAEHMTELARHWNVDMAPLPHWAELTHALQILRYVETLSIRMLWISARTRQCRSPISAACVRSSRTDLFLADDVLPAAIWGEKTGTFTNVDRTCHISLKALAVSEPCRAAPFADHERRGRRGNRATVRALTSVRLPLPEQDIFTHACQPGSRQVVVATG